MDFELTGAQQAIVEAVAKLCARFGDEYWLARDRGGQFPNEFHAALAEGGWLGLTMPQELGGAGLGVTEAALMMRTIAAGGGGMAAASAIHINLFGPHPIVVHGTPEQKGRWLPGLIAGRDRTCFGVTEPDAGLDTTRIATRAERAAGGYVVHGQKIWTSTAQHASHIMLLARTTPRESCSSKTDGLSLFYAPL